MTRTITLVLAAVLCVIGDGRPVAAAPEARLRGPDGQPVFLLGASYQGPADRAWRGDYWAWWATDRFDPALVAEDFRRARSAGLNTLRIFVQRELLQDIREDEWWKLDAVVDLARQHGLMLIVTFGDYDQPRVGEVAKTSAQIARRYAGHPSILAYELRNEPTFWTLQTARYPNGAQPPLLSRRPVEEYGEQAARHYIEAFRASEEGTSGPLAIPEWFSEDDAYYYHNNWLLSYKLSLEASSWALDRGASDLAYFTSPGAARWRSFLHALNATFEAWLDPQIDALRAADPTKPISVGHHEALLAALPANRKLDFVSLHRYSPPGLSGLQDQSRTLAALRSLFPDKPVVLGEFGHRTTELGEAQAAIEEAALFAQLRADGYAGGLKWLLTDTRDATDTMGLFRMDGSAKPLAYATAQLARQVAKNGTPVFGAREVGDLCYQLQLDAAIALGGACPGDGPVTVSGDGPVQVFVDWGQAGTIEFAVTAPARVELRLAQILGAAGGPGWIIESEGLSIAARFSQSGDLVSFDARPELVYRLRR
jgi:hypothetical protein